MKKNKILTLAAIAVTSLALSSCEEIKPWIDSAFGSTEEAPSEAPSTTIPDSTVVEVADFSVHFLELGNSYAGDCTYIKAGDTDILIDAGSRQSSASTIKNYINQYVTDGKLEYVIATHGDQDHISAFTDSSKTPGIISSYEIETFIDFKYTNKTTQAYRNYVTLRDLEIDAGANHYYTDDLFGPEKEHDNVFELAPGIKMTILDQKYYHEKSSDENNHSVVALFTVGEDNHFLFTGDLEKEGEESLVQLNPNLPKVKLFKGGHHGSKTSSNDVLLSKIQPEVVCVCCCAGSSEYTGISINMFPTQAFIDRVARYTKQIYVTSLAKYEVAVAGKNVTGVPEGVEYLKTTGFTSMNGNINVKFSNNELTVNCSNNNTILKDTEWFNTLYTLDGSTYNMRTWPSYGVK